MSNDEWLSNYDEPLKGFSWRGGCERETIGILVWSEIFRMPNKDGKEMGIILMDTQGAFDSDSTVKDNATIFAFSTMISSVQIFNLFHNLQEDDLQNLQLFAEYGRLALEQSIGTSFQKLVFLIRDWSFPYEAEYGFRGGKTILQRRLAIDKDQHPNLQQIRKHISSCFQDMSCFLMPHPGLFVSTNPSFIGSLHEIDPVFVRHLKYFVESILTPPNLVSKEINGQKISCKDLLEYFKIYINIFNGDQLPEPMTVLQATAEANNLTAFAKAKNHYCTEMEKVCGIGKPYLNLPQLSIIHEQILVHSLDVFNNACKMGGEEFSSPYKERLQKDILQAFELYSRQNERNNVFGSVFTPIILIFTTIVFYALSCFFCLLPFRTLTKITNQIFILSILTLLLWIYIRVKGEFVEVGAHIDSLTWSIYLYILLPMVHFLVSLNSNN